MGILRFGVRHKVGKEKIEGRKKKTEEEEECALLVRFSVSGMLLRNPAGNVSYS